MEKRAEMLREERLCRHRIDRETLLPKLPDPNSFERPNPQSFEAILSYYSTRDDRHGFIDSMARADARLEVISRLRARYRKRRERVGAVIAKKLLSAMQGQEVVVTASHGAIRRPLDRVELMGASIDLAKGTLMLGQHSWSAISIQIKQHALEQHDKPDAAPNRAVETEIIVARLREFVAPLIEGGKTITQRMFDEQVPLRPGTKRRVIAEKKLRQLFKGMVPKQQRATRGPSPSRRRSR